SLGEFVFDQGWAEAAYRAGIEYYPKLLAGVPFTPVTGPRFLTAGGERRAIIDAFATALEEICRRRELSSVHVNFCLDEEVEVLAARGWLQRTGFQYHWTNPGFASFDDYLASLRSKRRNQTRREMRELAAQGVTIETLVGDAIPDALFPTMSALYARTASELVWGREYLNRRFFELVGERLRPRLCLVVARQRGEVVAGTFNVQKGAALYGRHWGAFRQLRHLHFNVCYYAAIAHCIAAGLRRFEPGAGGEWKQLRGFDPVPTQSMHFIRDPELRDAVSRALVRERRAIAREIRFREARSALRRDGPD
ncbi:MAG TPA: GNAT family N-acetyltransferase, partial [Candidatus Binatia bacterium]|nr:GNAT family N-acetyltransferase [Candidatus Binatia bacterium]